MADDTEKEVVRKYMEKHGLKPSNLADKAGAGRWSVCKWLKEPDATLTMTIWRRLASYMAMNP
jgi:antitoxin component HigA of HigAB toxin-antitoxin module